MTDTERAPSTYLVQLWADSGSDEGSEWATKVRAWDALEAADVVFGDSRWIRNRTPFDRVTVTPVEREA